jgi:hypothetical protein
MSSKIKDLLRGNEQRTLLRLRRLRAVNEQRILLSLRRARTTSWRLAKAMKATD